MPRYENVVDPSIGRIYDAVNLTEEDADRLFRLVTVLHQKRAKNRLRRDFYHMHVNVQNIGIALSCEMLDKIRVACSWPAKAVDVLAQRSILDGFVFESGAEDEHMQRILLDNRMAQKYPMAAVSEGICSGMMWTLSRGKVGRSNVRIKTHSFETSAGIWDGNEERLECGMAVISNRDFTPWDAQLGFAPDVINLYTPDATVVLRRSTDGKRWEAEYHRHGMGRPLMEPMCFAPSMDRPFGKSRISRAVMGITMSKLREDCRSEISAEFFTTPQKFLLGATDEAFDMDRYQAYIGNIFIASKDEDGDVPQFGQLTQGSMQPHVEYARSLAAQFAGETAIPLHSLGVVSDNPDSAEAMQMAERDLVQLAEQMNRGNGESLRNVALMAMALEKGPMASIDDLTDDEYSVMVKWHNPSMPSIAATADAWQKAATVAPYIAQTEEFLEGLGIDRATRRRMLNQKRVIDGRSFMEVSVGSDDTTGGDASLLRADEGGAGLGTRVRVNGVIGDDGSGPVGGLIEG